MNDARIAAPLVAALAEKGFDKLTPVQDAVLAEGLAGRDLLVSAQTGSGKTVAFGLAVAPEVLDGQDQLLFAAAPLALVVAPTRELALQVERELRWLYKPAGAHLATCVGGMDYRSERRALERGAHIVVGTPGRLRDHIERGSLDLSAIRAVVLDEADEMLDLGFAEDLEFILGAAPETRRTLMFSATVPKEIEKLAGSYQRDAARVVAQGEAKQHVDIAYQALSVALRDKEHAIFNLLRFHEARTAIVFCKTRANVNHLHARMVNRGFQVVALSGELSQSERSHALQALRDGRARVCIATDVAARGIDLPGLELVVHADLPSNSETLLHRSGRTGRAGRKGISALIVVPSEYRKASRILQGAKVEAEWGKAPGADEVQVREDERLISHPLLSDAPGEEAAMAEALIARHGAAQVAAAFVRLWREGRSAPEVLSDSLPPAPPVPAREKGERGEFGPSVWFRLSKGHRDRAEARWLLPKICDAGAISKDAIGAIRVKEEVTFVQILATHAGRFGQMTELDRDLMMERLETAPDLDRPAPRRPAAGAAPKKPYAPKPPRVVEEGEALAAPVPPAAEAPSSPAPAPVVEAEAPRKPYSPREGSERKPYSPRAEGEAPRKPYARREDGERRPYAPREDGERKPWPRREDGERKPWARAEGAERKPYTPREGGERKPYTPRPEGEAPRKPYKPRAEGEATRKPYAPRAEGEAPRKPYTPREGGERKPYTPPREGGEAPRKPRWSAEDRARPRSAGYKSHGGGAQEDRPSRAHGYKSHAAEGGGAPRTYAPKGAEARPYVRREGEASGAGKPGGFKGGAEGGKKPYAPRPKPAAPKAPPKGDARDTSKRFTPPRKPKG